MEKLNFFFNDSLREKKRSGQFDGSKQPPKSAPRSSEVTTISANYHAECDGSAPRRNRELASLACGGVGGRTLTPSVANRDDARPDSDGWKLDEDARGNIDGETTKINTTASGRRISAPSVFLSPNDQKHHPSSVDSRGNCTTRKRPAVEKPSSQTQDDKVLGLDEASHASGSRIMDLKILLASIQI